MIPDTDMSNNLDEAVKNYFILLDTCFAMQPGDAFKLFLKRFESALQKNPINVPYKTIMELTGLQRDKTAVDKNGNNVYDLARRANNRIAKSQKKGIVVVREDKEKDRGVINDAVIYRVAVDFLQRKPVLVLTHDKKLQDALMGLKQQQSFSTHDLIIAGLSKDGNIFDWDNRANKTATIKPSNPKTMRPNTQRSFRPAASPFRVSTQLVSGYDTPITVMEEIKEGSFVSTKNGDRITLRNQIANGGEGTVYGSDDGTIVCKIYHNKNLVKGLQEKIELMLTRKIIDEQICYPLDAVYDSTKTFRGYIMRRASGKPLGHHLFHPSFTKTNPQWNRKHSTQLALSILLKIEYLHSLNIIIGDINPMNILVVDEKTVYFVDCDSYQVEGYPCPVGTPVFAAPEIQGKDFKTFLRTKDHELFAVATLLFMLFMPGKAPYGHEGGEGVAENIKQGHFPYCYKEKATANAPKGKWRFCWSHLANLKGAFNRSFSAEERSEGRVPIEKWIASIKGYGRILEQEGFQGPAEQAGIDFSLFPENLCRQEKDGEIKPPFRRDGKTDLQRETEKLIEEISGSYQPSNTSTKVGGSYSPPQPPSNPSVSPPAKPTGIVEVLSGWLKKLLQ